MTESRAKPATALPVILVLPAPVGVAGECWVLGGRGLSVIGARSRVGMNSVVDSFLKERVVVPNMFFGLSIVMLLFQASTGFLLKQDDSLDHRIVARSVHADFIYKGSAIKVTSNDKGLLVDKTGGPETVQALLGPELKGDFEADLEVEIAGLEELDIASSGGTPVPYYGFRSTSGKFEQYFLLSTLTGGWEKFTFHIRRDGNKISARHNRTEVKGHSNSKDSSDDGFLVFHMNDISKIRVIGCCIQDKATGKTFRYGAATNDEVITPNR